MRLSRVALFIHSATVLALLALFAAAAAAASGPDANIGLGLVGLPLLALGLPWSLHFMIDPYAYDDAATPVWLLAALGPTVLNLLIHAVIVWLRGPGSPGRARPAGAR